MSPEFHLSPHSMSEYKRRSRTTFSKQQLDTLYEAFRETHYPEADYRERLAKRTALDAGRIQVWFQNMRAKNRKRRGISGDYHASGQDYQQASHSYQHQSRHSPILGGLDQNQFSQHHHIDNRHINNNGDHHLFSPQMSSSSSSTCFFAPTPMSPGSLSGSTSSSSKRSPTNDSKFVFTSSMANDAARAVKEGRVGSLVDYFHNYCGNKKTAPTTSLSTNNLNQKPSLTPSSTPIAKSSSHKNQTSQLAALLTSSSDSDFLASQTISTSNNNTNGHSHHRSSSKFMDAAGLLSSDGDYLSPSSSSSFRNHNSNWSTDKRDMRNLAYQNGLRPSSSSSSNHHPYYDYHHHQPLGSVHE